MRTKLMTLKAELLSLNLRPKEAICQDLVAASSKGYGRETTQQNQAYAEEMAAAAGAVEAEG